MYRTKVSPFCNRWGDTRTISVWVEPVEEDEVEDEEEAEIQQFYDDYPEYSDWEGDPDDMRELAQEEYAEVIYAWADGDVSHAVFYQADYIGVDLEDVANYHDGDTGDVPMSCIDMDEWGRQIFIDNDHYFEYCNEYYHIH